MSFSSMVARAPPFVSRSGRTGSVRLRIRLHRCRYRVVEQPRGVLPRELADVVGREVADLLVQDLLAVGPRAVLVRVVRLEQHVVDADAVAMVESGRIVDRAEPEVAAEDLARREVD